MNASTSKRVYASVLALLLLISYIMVRDTVRVEGSVPRKDVKAAVAGLKEWSTPKLFRHIEVSLDRRNRLIAKVREPDHHFSVTIFENYDGAWHQFEWFLLAEDTNRLSYFPQH